MQSKLDPFHLQIVSQFFKTKTDYINLISVKKLFSELLDRFRINPIPITKETKNLFQYLDTQQIFKEDNNEIILKDVEIIQFNYPISYIRYLNLKKKYKDKQLKCKHVKFTQDECAAFHDIPEEVTLLDENCFYTFSVKEICIPSNVTFSLFF